MDNGVTWEDVSGDLPGHGVSIQIDTISNTVFFQGEGSSLHKSTDLGTNWEMISNPSIWELLVDNSNGLMFGGKHVYRYRDGGVYVSYDHGYNWELAGLHYLPALSIALNSTGSKIFVRSYGVGLCPGILFWCYQKTNMFDFRKVGIHQSVESAKRYRSIC